MLVGNKLRMRRRIRKMSLQEVADISGISIGLLSQIERGSSIPSLRSLQQICHALGMPIAWLFEADAADANGVVVTQSTRRRLDLGKNGMMKELLSPDTVPDIQMIRIVIHPGGFSGEKPYNAKSGAKCGVVLSGTLGLEVEQVEYSIPAGDSFAFDATKMHRFWCAGNSPVELIWVVTPALY
ncbi:helix-turn-helix domain-containing protein [Mesorhizobium sp. B2-6-5]|nr:helix-turn-helix domain-containing protein [Mesorhizobium sp. B2-6-5]